MKNWKVLVFALIGCTFVVAGCAKKSNEQASIDGTGFDTISSTDDLSQLPGLPQVSRASQQAGVEVLPIETSPITQQAAPLAGTGLAVMAADASGLSQDQRIQTALKNAGLYQGNIDGKIGPASKRAIQEFQRANSLTADGKVGPKTWAALEPYLSGAPQTEYTQPIES